jgi:hypothetical protein
VPDFADFGQKVPSMRVDLALPASEKMTIVLEAVGYDKVRVNSYSLESPVLVLADQSLEVVAIKKQILVRRAGRAAEWLNLDPTGMVEAGLRSGNGVTMSRCKQQRCMRWLARLQRCRAS